jgi:hypothetical protein
MLPHCGMSAQGRSDRRCSGIDAASRFCARRINTGISAGSGKIITDIRARSGKNTGIIIGCEILICTL